MPIDTRGIPLIGGQMYQVGQVVEILGQACTPQPSIVVKAFFANVPMLVWSLVKPDPVDFLTSRFGTGHKRRRKNRFRINDVDIGTTKDKGGLAWAEFSTVKLLERVGWYFLVMDATTDFAINWTSMAYRWGGCQDPLSGYATMTRITAQEYFSVGTPVPIGGGTPSFTPGYHATNAVVAKHFPGARMVTGNASFGQPSSTPFANILSVDIVSSLPTPTIADAMQGSIKQPDNTQTFSGVYRGYNILEPPQSYLLQITATTGWVRVNNLRLSVSGFDQPGLEPDP